MKSEELIVYAANIGIDIRYLRVGFLEPGAYDKFCILRNDVGLWEVFHAERGVRENLQVFESEGDATSYFMGWISSFPDLRLKG